MSHILVICAHPNLRKSRLNKALMDTAQGIDNVEVHDLYQHYPDFDIDIPAEQQRLKEAQAVIFLHPIYWYSCPALMKEWIDSVLQQGFAFGKGGDKLAGKPWLSAISTGGNEATYCGTGRHFYGVDQFMIPFERTAHLCGMRYIAPLVCHDANHISPDAISAHCQRFVDSITQMTHAIAQGE